MSAFESPVTDADIAREFDGTNFGPVDRRKHLEQCVLQRLVGYGTGHTSTQIMMRLNLIDGQERVTKKGKRFLFAAFYSRSNA